jgi:uncharacterized protein YbjT (DUF2867 family)
MPTGPAAKVPRASKSLLVLVTGATGRQGGTVAQQLLARGHRVRALVRNAENPKLKDLRAQHVEFAVGTFDDPASIEQAARGVDAMFLMGTPFGVGAEAEARHGKGAVDAAKRAGVPWLVFSSVANADTRTGIPHFESKFAVEEHLGRSGVPHAISAPTAFMENLLAPYSLPALREGKLSGGTSPDRPVQMVNMDDLSTFVTHVIEEPSRFSHRRINVASDSVSQAEIARVLSELAARPMAYQRIPIEALRAQSGDLSKMYEWMELTGYTADIEGLRREYPQVGWHRFRDWAALQDWPSILG